MTYTEAVAAVAAGKSTRRPSWPAAAVVRKSASGSTVIAGQGGTPDEKPYTASVEDKAATDWTSN